MATTAAATQFYYAATPGAGGTASTELTPVMSITAPKFMRNKVPTKHLGSTVGTSIPAIAEYEDVSVVYQYSASLFSTVAALTALRTFKIDFPDTTGTITFDGYTTGHEVSFSGVDELVTVTWTIAVTSVITIVVGS